MMFDELWYVIKMKQTPKKAHIDSTHRHLVHRPSLIDQTLFFCPFLSSISERTKCPTIFVKSMLSVPVSGFKKLRSSVTSD